MDKYSSMADTIIDSNNNILNQKTLKNDAIHFRCSSDLKKRIQNLSQESGFSISGIVLESLDLFFQMMDFKISIVYNDTSPALDFP